MPSPELSICVLHYNNWELTKACLESIDRQEIPCSNEKIVVDNGSTPGWPSDQCLKRFKTWTIFRVEENRGNIGGQNLCFQMASGRLVLFVANDVLLLPKCIHRLVNRHVNGFILQPRLFTADRQIDNFGLVWRWPGYGMAYRGKYEFLERDAFTSTCYLMEKSTWEIAGEFDETLTSSHEDIDFSLRATRMGFKLCCPDNALAIHLGNQTLKHTIANPRKTFHEARVKVVTKHYRGLARLLRLAAIHCLDRLPRF